MNFSTTAFRQGGKKPVQVNLPNPKPTVELPPALAETLQRIIAAGCFGISTLELFDSGLISVHNNVTELRKLGARIDTEIRPVTNWKGRDRKGIAHYIYMRWT
jgi:hypothetical protein